MEAACLFWKSTVCPSSSCNLLATGANDKSELNSPLGLPKCAPITSDAPRSSRYFMVGSDARIRPSSVMTPFLIGTFKSQRRKTRLPATSSEASEFITAFYQRT